MALDFLPGQVLPGRHQGGTLCFGSLPLTHHFPFQNTGPTSAYPGCYPRPWLFRASSSRVAYGWRLLRKGPALREPRGVTPFLASIVRLLRAVLSTGFVGSADRSMERVAGAVSSVILTPARQPLALVRLSRWLNHTFTFVAHRCLLDGIPGLRLPGFRRLTPLQTLEHQSPVWGLRFHSCTGREGLAPSWKAKLRG